MQVFAIESSERFPEQVSGILVPDNGRNIRFPEELPNYYNLESPTPVIALFVSEFMMTLAEGMLDDKYLSDLVDVRAIATFGRRQESRGAFTNVRSHLEIVAHEFGYPLIKLAVPESYPRLVNPKNDEDPYFKTWIENNPLKNFYSKQVILEQNGTEATFSLIGS